jgi:hypothetical protein
MVEFRPCMHSGFCFKCFYEWRKNVDVLTCPWCGTHIERCLLGVEEPPQFVAYLETIAWFSSALAGQGIRALISYILLLLAIEGYHALRSCGAGGG